MEISDRGARAAADAPTARAVERPLRLFQLAVAVVLLAWWAALAAALWVTVG